MEIRKIKKGQLEMSIGTIVVLVIGVSMLILGIILVRNIMCSGLQITKAVTQGVSNQVQSLFSSDEIGVHCAGEGGEVINLGTGGPRDIICIIKTNDQVKYDIQVVKVESISGASSEAVNKWIVDKGFSGAVSPGAGKSVVYLSLNIPDKAPSTTIKTTLSVKTDTGSEDTIITKVNVVPTNLIQGAIC